ncbi:Uncharacterised protein [Vibrio cholerae]|nr:hypothetical protein OSU_3500 [Vibrio cholerae PS15]CSB22440.1 Uncharacterised protein [Vibrio cholerae]
MVHPAFEYPLQWFGFSLRHQIQAMTTSHASFFPSSGAILNRFILIQTFLGHYCGPEKKK